MRKIFISVTTALLLSPGVQAADLIVDAPVVAPAPSVDNWTGFYAGIHAGYLWADLDYSGDDDAGWTPAGGSFGVQAGYNWQIDRLVLGIEGDVSYGGWATGPYEQGGVAQWGDDYYVASPDWLGSLRARVGYDFDGILPYLTAGVAAAAVHVEEPGYSEDHSHVGFAVGAGLEAKLDENWSVKGEYIYADLGEEDYYDYPTALTQQTVTIGLNFGF